MYQFKNLRVESIPSGGYILRKKSEEDWELYYSISGPKYNSCKICGFPLKEKQRCYHHRGLINLKTEFQINFIGYYKTDINGCPLNLFTERLLSMKSPHASLYRFELSFLLSALYDKYIKPHTVKWGSWVPSSNKLFEDIARELILAKNLSLIEPNEIFEWKNNLQKLHNHKEYVITKYKLKENVNNEIKDKIHNNSGVIIDDIIHTCFTIGRVLSLINIFNPRNVFCLALARTSKGKHPSIIKYPNF